tara:strand:+ start:413 stop:637 length:225 start_codon:yes stop_codon:yes gene_type:complete
MSKLKDKSMGKLLHARDKLKDDLSKLNDELDYYEQSIKRQLIWMVMDEETPSHDAWNCLKVDHVQLKRRFTLEE